MTCPDWPSLRTQRDQRPELWDEALEHLDGCPECHEAALAAEPTLLFRGMGEITVDAGEIAAMKSAVSTLRRSEALQETLEHPARRVSTGWLRAAAVAAAVVGATLLGGGLMSMGEDPLPASQTVAAVTAPAEADPIATPAPVVEQAPLVEDVDPSYGSVVQVVDQDISLVVVLPGSQGV